MRRHHIAILLSATAVVLAGCSDSEAGTPQPGDTTGPTSATSDERSTTSSGSDGDDLPSNGAPKVANPIDTSAFEQQPCQMLADDQARQAGVVPPGESGDGAVAPSCTWRNRESGASLGTEFENETRLGLSAAYRGNEAGKIEFWQELEPIEGFPAVVANVTDRRDSGECMIIVGTSDEVAFDLQVMLSDARIGTVDPCDAAVQVAALALQTMKGEQ